jgi:hypothetical protein
MVQSLYSEKRGDPPHESMISHVGGSGEGDQFANPIDRGGRPRHMPRCSSIPPPGPLRPEGGTPPPGDRPFMGRARAVAPRPRPIRQSDPMWRSKGGYDLRLRAAGLRR